MTITKLRVSNTLIGVAGVHFVVSQLSLRGLIALPTIRNTAGVDVLVSSVDGSWHANLQVKTSQNKVAFWPVGTTYDQWLGENNYYVFVRLLPKEAGFEAFLETSNIVAKQIQAGIDTTRAQGLKDWTPCWSLPKGKIDVERLQCQWRELGLNKVNGLGS